MVFKLGFIINPVAGIGGAVALKGSDGIETLKKARSLGGISQAQSRAKTALEMIIDVREQLVIYTAANEMGENIAREMGFDVQVLGDNCSGKTSPKDTETAVLKMPEQGIDCLMFAGGDGTARNVYNALKSLNLHHKLTVLGIPAGCKIHSAVYAVTPKHAGDLLQLMIRGRPLAKREAQVMDIDEDLFRQNIVKAKPYGELMVAAENQYMQNMKEGGIVHEEIILQDIAAYIVEEMSNDCLYLIGSGTTPKAILDELQLDTTLLGVDAVFNRQLLLADVSEKQILDLFTTHKNVKLVITLIGGQGHVLGRGNQQLSAQVITQIGIENIIFIAAPEKIHRLEGAPLRVDTGDEKLNQKLCGMVTIITGYDERTLYRIEN